MKSLHQYRVEAFMLRANQNVPVVPTNPSKEVLELRARLIMEEALETISAMGVEIRDTVDDCIIAYNHLAFEKRDHLEFDLVEVIDGCCDLKVVTTGTLSACGIPDEIFQEEVDTNNLNKFGLGHSIRADGKLIKPLSHQPPQIQTILDFLARRPGTP